MFQILGVPNEIGDDGRTRRKKKVIRTVWKNTEERRLIGAGVFQEIRNDLWCSCEGGLAMVVDNECVCGVLGESDEHVYNV